jgi:hypothetical protein
MANTYDNLNLTSLTGLIGNNFLSNVTINNSVRIPRTAKESNLTSDHANAAIYLKDINSSSGEGIFYKINANGISGTPALYFNNELVINDGNLLSELEYLLVDLNYSLETSNIIVHGGYINFYNGVNPFDNTNQGDSGVGIRYSANGTVQFKNYNTGWIDMVDITTHDQFSELIDVDVYSNPLQNNQYITFNASSNLFVNSNLAIINDTNPTLGGNLNISSYLLKYGTSNGRIVYNSGGVINNNLLVLQNNTITTNDCNYIQIANNDGSNSPSITAKGMTTVDVGLDINATGNADISLNSSLGNVNVNADLLAVSGYMKNSIFRTSTKPGGYSPGVSYNIPINNDTILFDFSNTAIAGTYWANVAAGLDGQKLNMIYNKKTSNAITVLSNFGTNGLIVGSGYTTGLSMDTLGQSVSMVYVGDGINAWHVLNTGAGVF